MNTVTSNFARIQGAPWFSIVKDIKAAIVGVGGIGSNVAYSLSRLGINDLFLMDGDTVSNENINGQFYTSDDVGRYKVSALKNALRNYSPSQCVRGSNYFYNTNNSSALIHANTIISGFDNMSARRMLFSNIQDKLSDTSKPFLYIDGRMSANEIQIFVLTSLQEDSYRCKLYSDNYLFSDEEATRTVCSFKQTSYVAQMIGGIITNIVINFWSNVLLDEENNFPRSVPFILEYNSDLMIFNVKE